MPPTPTQGGSPGHGSSKPLCTRHHTATVRKNGCPLRFRWMPAGVIGPAFPGFAAFKGHLLQFPREPDWAVASRVVVLPVELCSAPHSSVAVRCPERRGAALTPGQRGINGRGPPQVGWRPFMPRKALAAARAALGFAHEASDEFGAAQVRCDEGCGRSQGVLPQSGWRTACLGRRTTRNVLGH